MNRYDENIDERFYTYLEMKFGMDTKKYWEAVLFLRRAFT